MRDIIAAKEVMDMTTVKPIPRHFKILRDLKVKVIDRIQIGIRTGNVNKRLAQCDSRWI